jgi:NADPH:quinone reductase-like Zn-dependent oxidoreductase
VSIFALQFSLVAGARVIATTGSDGKIDRVKHWGATAGINYPTPPKWDRTVRELSGGSGADPVVEAGGID